MLEAILAMMNSGERLTFTIEAEGDQVKLVLTPKLKALTDAQEKALENNPAAAQARAALAMSLILRGSAEEVVAQFGDRVSKVGEKRAELHDGFSTLMDALDDASKGAKAAGKNTGKKASEKKAEDKPAEKSESPAPAPGGKNPDNLFGNAKSAGGEQ